MSINTDEKRFYPRYLCLENVVFNKNLRPRLFFASDLFVIEGEMWEYERFATKINDFAKFLQLLSGILRGESLYLKIILISTLPNYSIIGFF